jgi:hypothetical protein
MDGTFEMRESRRALPGDIYLGYHPIIRIELHRGHWQTLHSVMWTGPFQRAGVFGRQLLLRHEL